MMKNVQVTRDGSVHHAHKTCAVIVVLHIPYRWPMRTDPHFLHFLEQHTQKCELSNWILHVQNVFQSNGNMYIFYSWSCDGF